MPKNKDKIKKEPRTAPGEYKPPEKKDDRWLKPGDENPWNFEPRRGSDAWREWVANSARASEDQGRGGRG